MFVIEANVFCNNYVGWPMRYVNLVRYFSNWWLYLMVKFGLTYDDPLIFKTRKGVLIEVPRSLLHTFKEIFMEECYLRGMKFSLGKKPVVIDIGANAGFFTLFALSELSASVVSYEPIPVNFRQLKRNIELNHGFPATCFQKAVAGQSGMVSLSYDVHDGFTTTATMCEGTERTAASVKAESGSLSDVFQENNLDKCDLLKMDCEGAEFDILYNCPSEILRRIRHMAMEIHGGPEPNRNINALETYLRKGGFTTCRRSVGMLWAWRE